MSALGKSTSLVLMGVFPPKTGEAHRIPFEQIPLIMFQPEFFMPYSRTPHDSMRGFVIVFQTLTEQTPSPAAQSTPSSGGGELDPSPGAGEEPRGAGTRPSLAPLSSAVNQLSGSLGGKFANSLGTSCWPIRSSTNIVYIIRPENTPFT